MVIKRSLTLLTAFFFILLGMAIPLQAEQFTLVNANGAEKTYSYELIPGEQSTVAHVVAAHGDHVEPGTRFELVLKYPDLAPAIKSATITAETLVEQLSPAATYRVARLPAQGAPAVVPAGQQLPGQQPRAPQFMVTVMAPSLLGRLDIQQQHELATLTPAQSLARVKELVKALNLDPEKYDFFVRDPVHNKDLPLAAGKALSAQYPFLITPGQQQIYMIEKPVASQGPPADNEPLWQRSDVQVAAVAVTSIAAVMALIAYKKGWFKKAKEKMARFIGRGQKEKVDDEAATGKGGTQPIAEEVELHEKIV